uniref:Uncharacterized protein n=1 Tax=Triticum urartu TaxID=4572 RepID=A0A8R7V5N4_TRIUA
MGHHRVQLGRQVRRRPDPRHPAAAEGGARGAPPRHARGVPRQGGALRVRVHGQERRRRGQRRAQPRRDALRAPVEQHAVRHQRRVPPLRLLG